MSQSHCLLILSDSGLPLYTRTSDRQSTALPFSTSGLLSALHSSSAAQHFPVAALHTADATMRFLHCDHLVLILASHTAQPQHHTLHRMMDCLTLLMGRRAVQDDRQLQRIKRRIRLCTPMLDWWMQQGSAGWGRLTGLPEWRLDSGEEAAWMGELLSEVSSLCGTRHVCLYDRERLLLPSSHYASLHPHDLLSIAAYLATLPHPAPASHPADPPAHPAQPAQPAQPAHDQPIYLSHSTLHRRPVDGNTAYRLLAVSLMPTTTLYAVLLCGPAPSALEVEERVGRLAGPYEERLVRWAGQGGTVLVEGAEAIDASTALCGVVLWKREQCWPVPVTQAGDSGAEQQLHAFYCMTAEEMSAADRHESYMLQGGVVLYGMRRGDWQLFVALRAAGAKSARAYCELQLLREQQRHSEQQHMLAQLKI